MTALIILTIVAVLAISLGIGIWIGLALYLVGLTSLAAFKSLPIEKLISQLTWNVSTTPELIALPMFILMAENPVPVEAVLVPLHRTNAVDDPAAGASFARQCLGCTLFAAVSDHPPPRPQPSAGSR